MIGVRTLENFPTVVYWMLLAVIFFVPLISWDGFIFFTTFTKAIFFMVIVEIACIFWLSEAWQRLKLYGKSLMTYSILIFFCILILTSLSGVNFYKSFWGNYERMMGVWMYGHLILFYLMLISTIRSAEQWTKLFYTSAISSFLVALIGFFEMFSKSAPVRAESTFENATFLAQYLLISFFILLLLLMRDKKIRFRSAFLITALGFVLLTTFFTASRGAFLGLATGSFLALTLFILLGGSPEGTTLSLTHRLLKKVAIGLLVAIVLVGALGFTFRKQFASSPIYALRRLAISSFSEKTTASRLLLWKVSWNGWKERPVLGWGIENYNLLFNKYYDPKLFEQEGWFDRAHNFILDVGTSIGLVGLVSYIGIFLTSLYLLIKSLQKKYLSFLDFALFISLIVGYLIQNMFAFDILISLILLFTAFSYIHVMNSASKMSLKTNPKILPFAIGIGIMIPIFIVGTLMPLIENRLTNRAMYAFAQGKNDEGKKKLEQALTYHTYGNIEARRIMAEYIFESFKEKEQKISEPHPPELIDYAIEKIDQNIKEDSKNARWYAYQGRLYIQKALLGDSSSQENAKKAALILSEAVKLSPARYGTYLELAEARRIGGDVDGMWEATDVTIGQLPDVSMSHSIALSHAIETRTTDREQRETEWLFSHINASDSYRDLLYNKNGDLQLARDAYFHTGRFQDAIDFEKKVLDLIPPEKIVFIGNKDLATEYAWLAELYKKVGLYDEARTLALQVAKLDPEGREKEAELFLQTLQK